MVDWAELLQVPIGAVLMLVTAVILAGIAAAAAVSGQLTAAAVSAGGFLVLVFILAMLRFIK